MSVSEDMRKETSAGCPRVIAGQWTIDAAPTSEFVLAIHRAAVGNAAGKSQHRPAADWAAALRQAQLDFRHDARYRKYRDTRNWAGFVLVGDGFPPAGTEGNGP